MSIQHEKGPSHVRNAPDDACEALNSAIDSIVNVDENTGFCRNPAEYDWKYLGKQEMLVPYNCDASSVQKPKLHNQSKFPDPNFVRWEKHRVWIVEGTLQPGESNMMARRRFYVDEDSWFILLGEGYDNAGTMTKFYVPYHGLIPATNMQGRWYSASTQDSSSI
jgi:hypothetical protein